MNCHHLPICQLRGSCPWAIYGPRCGISKGEKEPIECCLFLFRGFYFFLCPRLPCFCQKSNWTHLWRLVTPEHLSASVFHYNPVICHCLHHLLPKPPSQTSVLVSQCQHSSLLGDYPFSPWHTHYPLYRSGFTNCSSQHSSTCAP